MDVAWASRLVSRIARTQREIVGYEAAVMIGATMALSPNCGFSRVLRANSCRTAMLQPTRLGSAFTQVSKLSPAIEPAFMTRAFGRVRRARFRLLIGGICSAISEMPSRLSPIGLAQQRVVRSMA